MHVEGPQLFLFGGAAAVVAEGRRQHCRGSRGRQLGAKPRHDMIIGIVPTMRLAAGPGMRPPAGFMEQCGEKSKLGASHVNQAFRYLMSLPMSSWNIHAQAPRSYRKLQEMQEVSADGSIMVAGPGQPDITRIPKD